MAWVANADFNGLTDGDLNGQGGGSGWSANWSGSTTYDVQGTTVYEGAKAITADSDDMSRTLTTDISDADSTLYVAMRKSSTSAGRAYFLLMTDALASRVDIRMNPTGTITGNGTTILASYSANTWYALKIVINTSGGSYTVAYSTDAFGTAGTFSAPVACTMGSTGNIGVVYLAADSGNSNFWDYISPTSPFTVAASTARTTNFSLLGVGT